MSRGKRKPSRADYKGLQRNTPVDVSYPPGAGPGQLRVSTTKPELRRKLNNEGGTT
jgi:hypothetical protein